MNIPFFVKYFMLSEITALLSCESKKEKVEKSSTSNGTVKCKTQHVRLKKKKNHNNSQPEKSSYQMWI